MAREVIQPSLHEVRNTLGAVIVAQEAAFERGLRARPRRSDKPAPDDKLLESVRSELAQVRSELSSVAARGVPAAVVCIASGKVHVGGQLQCNAVQRSAVGLGQHKWACTVSVSPTPKTGAVCAVHTPTALSWERMLKSLLRQGQGAR